MVNPIKLRGIAGWPGQEVEARRGQSAVLMAGILGCRKPGVGVGGERVGWG